nr:DUF433 domain-containing protein [Rhodoferax sp.]
MPPLRITVYDVLSMLSIGMTQQEILDDFPELSQEDILAVLAYAADGEHQVHSLTHEPPIFRPGRGLPRAATRD